MRVIKMKKYIVTFLLGIAIFFFFKSTSNPQKILLKHLEKRYNKEFVIAFGGKRSDRRSKWYEAEIYPKELKGTLREYDKYYWAKGFVEQGKGGDTYGKVLLNESANEFYLPKLKELFGENVLPVLELKGAYDSTDYEEEMKLRRKLFEKDSTGKYLPLSGGIYIFGRVESDKDREWYRKQIYEFVQFMKQTGTFEYVRLSIYIIDERMLVNGAEKCFKNIKYTSKTRKGITKEIDKALNPMTEEYNKLTTQEKLIKLSSYNKGNILNEIRGILLLVPIASPKYIDSNSFSDDEITELFGRKKEYNNINDIQFKYEDYAIKEVKNE